MSTRDYEIRRALRILSGEHFERFVFYLLNKERYPGTRITSRSFDLGEDGKTEESSLVFFDDKHYSIAASKTATLFKLRKDCIRIKKENPNKNIHTIAFGTMGPINENRKRSWKEKILQDYDFHLEVWDIDWIAITAIKPEYEKEVYDFLHVPPQGGDYIQDIRYSFSRETTQNLSKITNSIPGISGSIPREEVEEIEKHFLESKHLILIGKAGTGKTGIASLILDNWLGMGNNALFIDARKLIHVDSLSELERYFKLSGDIDTALLRVSRKDKLLLVLDQLDNVVSTAIEDILLDLVIRIKNNPNINIVVITRGRGLESKAVKKLNDIKFIPFEVNELPEEIVIVQLQKIEISNPSEDLIELASNILNLKIIATIKQKNPGFNFDNVLNELVIWEEYFLILEEDENSLRMGNPLKIIDEGEKLAELGMITGDKSFEIGNTLLKARQRLLSWDVIKKEPNGRYVFTHEKMHDYFYARVSCRKLLMPNYIIERIGVQFAKNVFSFMDLIYERDDSINHEKFFKELLNV